MSKHCFLITIGDPNGLGPEIIVRFFGQRRVSDLSVVIIGPESVLKEYCSIFGIDCFWDNIDGLNKPQKGIYLYSKPFLYFKPTPSKPSIEGGLVSVKALEVACELVKNQKASAIITCTVNKALIQAAGYKDFFGHTEFFARKFGISDQDICMHLCCSKLRVSLVTTHIPIKEVSNRITPYRVLKSIELTWRFLEKIRQNYAPIGVCGLNPHAGEEGKIGSEEKEVIIPAIKKAQKKGIHVKGPYSGDTLFYRAIKGEFSAVVAMYHDQGLAPLKAVCFDECINVTLGLPFIRTSVGHGTGYDLVGKGIASLKSFEQAILMAKRLNKV